MSIPYRLVFISDMHLSEGWSSSGYLSRNEDFFFDSSFKRFLAHLDQQAQAAETKYRLVINGDFVDFLQFTTVPEDDVFTGEIIAPKERTMGLGTSAAKTRYKLDLLFAGHQGFFGALADFVGAGHELFIGPGNHDIEWIMPEVQEGFRIKLQELWAHRSGAQDPGFSGRVAFYPWFYYDPEYSLFAEHGCQYDDANCFDNWLYPYRSDGSMELPAGSFFVRYLFNQLEQLYPFADNLKPQTKFIFWLLRQGKAWRRGTIWQALRSLWQIAGKAAPIEPNQAQLAGREQEEKLKQLADSSGISLQALYELKGRWAPSSLHHLSRLGLLSSFAANAKLGLDYYRERARQVQRSVGSRYVVFGHTHNADLLDITPPGATEKCEYVNSGSWTKNWAANYEEALLKSENEFVFIHFAYNEERQSVKMDLMRWNDGLGEGERVRLFGVE